LKPGTFVDVIELLIPELRRRGIFWENYAVEGGTYRENLRSQRGPHPPSDHPAAKYQWRAGVAKEDASIPAETQDVSIVQKEKVNGISKKRASEAPKDGQRAKRRSLRTGS
jgi:hypothetical protein